VADHCSEPLTLVVKSTVPVGTGDRLEELLRSLGQHDISVVSNPEFLRQGSAIKDFLQPDRVVIGASDWVSGQEVHSLYAGLNAPVIACSRRSAELAKYAANAMIATRISFMNEIAAVCGSCQADVQAVAEIIGSDHRIGRDYLKAGLGWGGSCFPKDVRALGAIAKSHGLATPIIDGAFATNMAQRSMAYDRIMSVIENVQRPFVGILGLAFKPNTDDLREAPAIDIALRLLRSGVSVKAHDPQAMANASRLVPDLICCCDPTDVAREVDVLFLATEWSDYLTLDWSSLAKLMRGRTVIDGRNFLPAEEILSNGLDYAPFGRVLPGVQNMTAEWQLEADLAAAS